MDSFRHSLTIFVSAPLYWVVENPAKHAVVRLWFMVHSEKNRFGAPQTGTGAADFHLAGTLPRR
jgi:hypothetical protein